MSDAKSPWASGQAYERYVGRWSRQLAPVFLDWIGAPPGRRWADVGAGTGALTATILARAAPASVSGVDLSEAFVRLAREQVTDARASFEVGDAGALPWGDASRDAAVSGLVLNFVPDPAAMVREMRRVTAPGGPVAAYVWDYGDGMQMMKRFWDAAIAVDAAARPVAESLRFPVCRPEALQALFEGTGLRNVQTRALEITQRFADFDDYWTPFLGGTGPAPAFLMSRDEATRGAIRRQLEAALGAGRPIELLARAWAVKGVA